MYKIGDFSKIVDIPVRTLRYYAEYGILVPSLVDKFTGYKYYDDENIVECELIKLLKSLDFTLDEIMRYKNDINYDVLEKKKKELEQRMYLLRLKYDRLSLMQEELKNKKKDKDIKVLRRMIDNDREDSK